MDGMKWRIHFVFIGVLVIVGCTDNGVTTHVSQPSDTLYTLQKAMDVYDYQPERALQIVDSAVIVGNVSEVWADGLRARIYSWTLMGQTVDSLLHGPEGVRFDSARVIGERLLVHDSLKVNIGMRQDVLEVLVYVARQQQDTARWLRRSQELVEVCHLQGDAAEPEALRTEAEMGAVLCMMGQRQQGMARLDSVIAILDSREHRQFNWLDATIIALKRKISVLENEGKYIEMLPLAQRIIDRLDDYEQHPQDYDDVKFDTGDGYLLPQLDRTPWGIIALKNASSYEMAHVKFYKSGEESKDPVAELTGSFSKDQVAKQGLAEGTYTVTYDFMDPNTNQVLSRWKVQNVKVRQGRDEASATTSASTVDAVIVN